MTHSKCSGTKAKYQGFYQRDSCRALDRMNFDSALKVEDSVAEEFLL